MFWVVRPSVRACAGTDTLRTACRRFLVVIVTTSK